MGFEVGGEIEYLHHVGLVVGDLEKALELYRRLGFEPTTPSYPMMSPEEGTPQEVFGAANAHIPFGRNFMEIVSVATKDTPIPAGAHLVQLWVPPDARKRVLETIRSMVTGLASSFSRFQGLHILVFQTPNVEATAGHLGAVGVGHSGPLTVQRPVDDQDQSLMTPVRVLEIDGKDVPEGRLAFAENPAPEILRTQSQTDHPNGAFDLIESVLCAEDARLADIERRYEKYLSRTARSEGAMRVFNLEASRIVLVPDTKLEEILPGEKAPALPAFVACGVAVRNIDTARRLLEGNGFSPMSRPLGDVFVPAAEALGAAVIFRQVP